MRRTSGRGGVEKGRGRRRRRRGRGGLLGTDEGELPFMEGADGIIAKSEEVNLRFVTICYFFLDL